MTSKNNSSNKNPVSASPLMAKNRLMVRRRRAERRFQWMGIGAIGIALLFLVFLLSTILSQGLPAFRYHYAKIPVDLTSVDVEKTKKGDYDKIFKASVKEVFPFMSGRRDKRKARGMFASASGFGISKQVEDQPSLAGAKRQLWLPLSDFADLYFKGDISRTQKIDLLNDTALTSEDGKTSLSLGQLAPTINNAFQNSDDVSKLGTNDSSLLIITDKSAIKVNSLIDGKASGEILLDYQDKPLAINQPYFLLIELPENFRKFTDKEIAAAEYLDQSGMIEGGWNTKFFTAGASREPENAGIWGAVVGTFYTLLVTLALCFPIGVAAAVYLEEFATKNLLTDIIEVNINNLAAVPSIVFGLLGLAVFLNWFELPRSAPLVGGIVLALMTLPTIIIATRAALRAVPPSIREGALGIGASRTQVVFHHVLPLAMPGILTGTIIGMAQALGETAPLLMIGMVAFIVDIPGGFTDPATVLPVQIFMWADFPEPAFRQKTAAAILVLLGFLVLMNALAVILRKRFERRW